jgi:uncharacterized protein (DUF1015 family)
MVKLFPIKGFLPKNPIEFCTPPYDVIEKEEEIELKKNPNSLIHLILPDGTDTEKLQNALKAFNKYIDQKLLSQIQIPSIFLYRQESAAFSHEGLILSVSGEDYEQGNVIKHEKTREKPLRERTALYESTNIVPGLVWTVYKNLSDLKPILENIKQSSPIMNFLSYNYTQKLWQITDPVILQQIFTLFEAKNIYIADGHHRAAAAAQYRKNRINSEKNLNQPWQNIMIYLAADDQVRILPYNRVIRKLPIETSQFLQKVSEIFEMIPLNQGKNPEKKHEITMYLKGKWYKLYYSKQITPDVKNLDVSILQDLVFDPILNITDPRSDENIFFVGGVTDPKQMETFVTQQGNDIFFNLFPVSIYDLEKIADQNEVMPPKSTWFDPKLLSGLILRNLK